MAPARVDLHVHTHHSDGLHAPRVLLAEMARLDLRLVAITDHDTLAAHTELAQGADLPASPFVLPGLEINSIAEHVPDVPEGELHILGLGIDLADERIERALASQRSARAARIAEIVRRLAEVGAPIDQELGALSRDGFSIGRPHLARALVSAGHVADFQEAFDRYLVPEGLAFVPRVGMTTYEAIDLIVAAGGLAILAHFRGADEQFDVVADLKDRGLGGLETYYSKWSPAQVRTVAEVAQRLDLLATAGTDYHGDRGSYADALARIDPPAHLEERLLEALEIGSNPVQQRPFPLDIAALPLTI